MRDQYETLRQRLIEKAKQRDVMFYSDIAPELGLDMGRDADRAELSRILGVLSRSEVQKGGPMLSAIVVAKGDGSPGSGFFKLAKELGRFELGDKDTFWMAELGRVYDWYTSTAN